MTKGDSKTERDEHYSADETARRRDAAMRKAMNTPPQKQASAGNRKSRSPAKSTAPKRG